MLQGRAKWCALALFRSVKIDSIRKKEYTYVYKYDTQQ